MEQQFNLWSTVLLSLFDLFILLLWTVYFSLILCSLCACLFALHSHSADRYDSDGGLDACALAAKQGAQLI